MIHVSLKEWWNLAIPLIDIRESQEDGSITSTESRVVVHLPFSSLLSGERSCELPPRHVVFSILYDAAGCGASLSKEKDRQQQLQNFFFATTSKATQQTRKPWQVAVAILATKTVWTEAKDLHLFNESNICNVTTGFVPLTRLWRPDPMIETLLWPLLQKFLTGEKAEIWDLGSGAGRDACYLAEQIKRYDLKCMVVGIDNHKASASRCTPFWKNRHVEEYTRAANLNLSKTELVREELQHKNVLCLYAVRFWNRKLVKFFAEESDFKPGTIFAMSHFCKPYPGAPWSFDHPKESRVLERSELATMFACDRWDVLHDELILDGDHGRSLIQFVAKLRVQSNT